MIGAFRPSAPLSGGLLWKIPWKLSSPRKFRHRLRMRNVDNVVAVLDKALKRDAATYETIANSAKAQAQAAKSASATSQEERRHGQGPKQGELLSERVPATLLKEDSPMMTRPTTTLLTDVARAQGTFKKLEQWKAEMPTEAEMLPRDKYTMFDRKVRGYRKGVHKLPKWTRVSQRVNPPGF